MTEETTLKDEIRALTSALDQSKMVKKKKFRLPLKAKLGKNKMRDGYVGLVIVNENKTIEFSKEPIIDSTIKVKDTFHAVDSDNLFFYKGKPFFFIAKNKLNPHDPLVGDNETYGQKYVMARMEGDKIITKKKAGLGIGIGVAIIAAVILYYVLSGG